MAVSTTHPLYAGHFPDWEQLRDTHAGERCIKQAGEKYLPPTAGMTADGMANANQPGSQAYAAYKQRAIYHNFVKDAVDGMTGIMHREPAVIEVPAKLEPMLERATIQGETAHALLRRINEQQLLYGRLGLLLEVGDGLGPDAIPYVATYSAFRIINWDDGERDDGLQRLELVVLNETEQVRNTEFDWELKEKYRILALAETLNIEGVASGYVVATADENTTDVLPQNFRVPQIAGKGLDDIPFVFINAQDLVPSPDIPPLLDLSNIALAVYRGEADFRQGLFAQGQETFVVIGRASHAGTVDGDEAETRTGAGALLDLPLGGDAKYVGVSAAGLVEMAAALEADKDEASNKGARLLSNLGGERQSGEALRVRVAAQTATLATVVQTGAEALATTLRTAAEWVGANPDEVVVEPNMDFADDPLTGKELLDLMSARAMGAPMSLESVHRIMQMRDLTEMEFEEEMTKVEDEMAAELERQDTGELDDPPPGSEDE